MMIKRKSAQQMTKKQLERLYLDHFLNLAHWDFPVEEHEAPDFLLRTAAGLLGVEVTRFFKNEGPRGSLSKEREVRRAAFLRELASEYYASGGRPLHVKLLWDGMPGNDVTSDVINRLHHERPMMP